MSSLLCVQVHEVSTEDEEEEEEEGEVIEEHEGTESEGEESGGEVYSSLPAEVLSSLSLSTGPRGGQWPSLCLSVVVSMAWHAEGCATEMSHMHIYWKEISDCTFSDISY